MLGERYFLLFIANLFIRKAHDSSVFLILQTPPMLETFHTIILMKKINLASLWIIEFSPALIFKSLQCLDMLKIVFTGQLKLSLSAQ